jgi:hypothetical protein
MKNISFHTGLLTLACTLLSGCVTINIYFPAAAAEKAADKIIEEVWQLKKPEGGGREGGDKSTPSETEPQPSTQPQQPLPPQQ